MAKGIMVVFSGPSAPEKEDAYNDWYENVHIPDILSVPGFQKATRYKLARPAGADTPVQPYLAVYEIEADTVPGAAAALSEHASHGGEERYSDALSTDPAPQVLLYELKD